VKDVGLQMVCVREEMNSVDQLELMDALQMLQGLLLAQVKTFLLQDVVIGKVMETQIVEDIVARLIQ